MLIYDAESPAPRCLRMFLAEKQLLFSAVTVDVFAGENREPAFLGVRGRHRRCDVMMAAHLAKR